MSINSASGGDENNVLDYENLDSDRIGPNLNNWQYSVISRWKRRLEIFDERIGKTDTVAESLLKPNAMFFQESKSNQNEVYQLIWGENSDSLKALIEGLEQMKTEFIPMKTELEQMKADSTQMEAEIQEYTPEFRALKQNKVLIERLIAASKENMKIYEFATREREKNIEKAKKIIGGKIECIISELIRKRATLGELASQSNETASKTGGDTHVTVNSERIYTDIDAQSSREAMDILRHLRENNDLTLSPNEWPDEMNSSEVKSKLFEFHDYIANIMMKGKAMKKNSNETIDNTLQCILSWKSGAEACANQCIPPPSGQEEVADQPFLHAVLVKMLQILGHGNEITREQDIANMDKTESGRRADFVLHPTREHLATIVPAMLDRAIEIKTYPTATTDLNNMHEKGNSQIIGHCARRALCSFDFGGIGEDAKVYGILLTVKSVQITKLTLSKVGATKIDLQAKRTRRMDLFTTDDEKISESREAFHQLAGALCELYPPGKNILETFIAEQDSNEHPWRFLGSGAFCNVLGQRPNTFLKIPKASNLVKSLEKEAMVLQKLADAPDSCKFPKVVGGGVKLVNHVIQGELLSMHLLQLTGIIGSTLGYFRHTNPNGCLKKIHIIIEKVFDALVAAHDQQVVHRDVRPSNIIILDDDPKELKVMLVDWGCAFYSHGCHDRASRKPCFVGCLPYAHDDLFRKKRKGKEGKVIFDRALLRRTMMNDDLDFASLAYTWFSIVEPDEFTVWSHNFDKDTNVMIEDLDKRRDAVMKALNENVTLKDTLKQRLIKACATRVPWLVGSACDDKK